MSGFDRPALRSRLGARMIVRDQTGAKCFDISMPVCRDPNLWAQAAFEAIKGWSRGDSVISTYTVERP